MRYRVAIIGANEPVGRELLRMLAERDFPAGEVVALGTGRVTGQELSYGEDKVLTLRPAEGFDFAHTHLVFASAGKGHAAAANRAAAAGAMVIDCSARNRLEVGVPLVVPEANLAALKATRHRMVANPSPAAITLAAVLAPLLPLARAQRIVATAHLPVSDVSKAAMDELFNQTRAVFVNDPSLPEQFPKPIAFNLIPQVERIEADGESAEEQGLALELRKILDPDLKVAATCIRAPVFIGLAIAAHIEFDRAVELEAVIETLRDAPGLQLVDKREDGGYVTPIECAGEDAVYVGRLRHDRTVPHGLAMWLVTDNLRKGSALNAVQIAEALVEQGLIGRPRAVPT